MASEEEKELTTNVEEEKVADYDKILEQMGSWGKYQIFIAFLIWFSTVPNGYFTTVAVFTHHTPPHRCRIPHLDGNDSFQAFDYKANQTANISDALLTPFIPRTGDAWSSCEIFDPESANYNDTISCDHGWVFYEEEGRTTIVTDWSLLCDQAWMKPIATTAYMVGVTTGSIAAGIISDRYGRRNVMLLSTYFQFVFMGILAIASNFTFYCVIYFASGWCSLVNFMTAVVLSLEIYDPVKRSLLGSLAMVGFSIGYMALVPIAYLTPGWRMIMVVITVPGILFIPYWWFIPESPRWLISMKRFDEAKRTLTFMAKKNGTYSKGLGDMISTIGNDMSVTSKVNFRKLYKELLNSAVMRNRLIIICAAWFINVLLYYFLALGSDMIGGDKYVISFLFAASEIPVFLMLYFGIVYLGRKLVYIASIQIASAACFACGIMIRYGLLGSLPLIILSLIGKTAGTIAFDVLYILSPEVFPTLLRTQTMGIAAFVGRIGGVIAPFILYAGENGDQSLTFFAVAASAAISGLSALLLPETRNATIPATTDEAEHMKTIEPCNNFN